MIPFNIPPYTGAEDQYVLQALHGGRLSGDGEFGRECENWFSKRLAVHRALLTPSCTAALEMAALLFNVQPGDEVIMPSYTFVSTANAFVLRGAVIRFVDIRPDTMNIDERLIESAITEKTKVVVPVHYAGIGCDMDVIMDIADRHGLYVVEDAAQGMMSSYMGRPLGTIGDLGVFSFHETKNYTSGGEGGLLVVNNSTFKERAEILREKGTNRSQFFRGMVDKYQWIDCGSSYLPSELQAAYLWGQLGKVDEINTARLVIWSRYLEELQPLADSGQIEVATTPDGCVHNAHMFYVKAADLVERTALIEHLKKNNVSAAFHYVPLHSSVAGKRFGSFSGSERYTTLESERLLRLPLWYGLPLQAQARVVAAINDFYK